MQRKYTAILGLVIAGIFIPIFLSNENASMDTYLLGGFIVAEVILFVFDQVFQSKREIRDDRKEHTKEINKIFIRMTHAVIRDRESGLNIVLPTKDIDIKKFDLDSLFAKEEITDYCEIRYLYLHEEYYFFDYAKEHLKNKKYNDIYKYWENTEKLLEEFNKRKRFMKIIYELIDSKMKESFLDFKKHHGDNDNFYDPYAIANIVLGLWEHEQEELNTLGIRVKYGKHCIVTEFGTRPQMGSPDESKLDLEKYKKFLKSLVTDQSLKQAYDQEVKSYTEIRLELQKFTDKLEFLVKQLKANKLLEGQCDGCP